MAANGKKPKDEMATVRHLFSQPTGNEKGCIIPHLRPNKKGYVPVQPNGNDAKKWRAHRLVYHCLVEPVTDDVLIMHTCDVRNCINPVHLKKGSAQDNTDDMMAKGRDYRGHRWQITVAHVAAFRVMRNQGMSNVAIGKATGFSHETVRAHLNGDLVVPEIA